MIISAANRQIKQINALRKLAKERKKQKLFVVEGIKMVKEAPPELVRAVYVSESLQKQKEHAEMLMGFQRAADSGKLRFEVLSDSVMKAVSDTQTPQGIMALVSMPEYDPEDLIKDRPAMLLVLESIQDPGNLGTMMRTGEGAGVTGVLMNRTTVDLFNPKTIRSTMGSIYRVPFYIADDLPEALEKLKAQGISFYAAHPKGEQEYDAVSYVSDCGFLIGNEGNGLSDEIIKKADSYIRIPMKGQVESLNAAVSASVLMYEANRQRRRNA